MRETDWFEGMSDEEAKAERGWLREFLGYVLGLVCLTALLIAAVWPTKAHADPIYHAEEGGVRVVLTDEPCKFDIQLPKRATWTEKGKTFEGCYGGHPVFPIVLFYFSDKSVVALPVEIFQRVTGA